MRGRGRGRGRGGYRRLFSRIRTVRNVINGRSLRLPADPPMFTQIPWNSITLEDTPTLGAEANQKSYNGSDLFNILKAQIGLDIDEAKTQFSLRIMSIMCWNLSGGEVNLQVEDFVIGFGAQDYLQQISDAPGRNRWAKCGYQLPASQNKVAFTSNDTENLFRVGAFKGDTLCVRVRLLWKTRVNTAPNEQLRMKDRISQLEARLNALQLASRSDIERGRSVRNDPRQMTRSDSLETFVTVESYDDRFNPRLN